MALAVAAASQAQALSKRPTSDQMRQMMEDREYWRQQRVRYEDIERRARKLEPKRRDSPLREVNISDNEIREVQSIAQAYLPRSLVNISPVVTDCPCEEGPTCTAQVYVVAQTQNKTRGLQLSRMNDRWGVSLAQQWYLRRAALVPSHTGNSFIDDYLDEKALNELYEEFPVCAGEMVPAQKTAVASKAEGKK
jgi:hypothetical protein